MEAVYNYRYQTKTTLNKIKKGDLIQMYLDLQSNNYMLLMENEERKSTMEQYKSMIEKYDIIIKKLETNIDNMKKELRARAFTIIELRNEIEKLKG